jgi:hypothetical protein
MKRPAAEFCERTTMTHATGLEELWDSAAPPVAAIDPGHFSTRPAIVQEYLAHAIAAGTPLASAVRLRMHGTIKLRRWRRFRAEQVIVRDRGMIWRARVRSRAFMIRGEDRLVGGEGAMNWKILGALPVMRAAGPDITRSVAGRVAAESIWLPSLLCDDKVGWHGENGVAQARFAVDGHAAEIALALNHGCVQSVSLARWGNPDGGAFRDASFGARVDQEATFGGYTIPARLRVGWYFDDPQRFDREGKFFEVSIDQAVYR